MSCTLQCDDCQTACQLACQTHCESYCQTACELCMSGCQVTCQTGCEVNCMSCVTCESACQFNCQTCETGCQLFCQTTCESSCQSCDSTCETTCEVSCQTCQTGCQLFCQTSCQSSCQDACQSSCQSGQVTAPPSAPVVTDRIDSGFFLAWGSVAGATSYTFCWRKDTEYNYAETTGTERAITGLIYGAMYFFSVCANNSAGSSAYSSENGATVNPKAPRISQGAVTARSITINTGSMSGSYDYIRVYRYSDSNQFQSSIDVQANSSATFTGLTPGTVYIFKANSYFTTTEGTLIASVNYSNTLDIEATARPANYSWTNPKVSGGDVNLSAAEWNSFTQKINDFRAYLGYSTITFTQAVAADNHTAANYTTALNALAEISSYFTAGTLPAARSSMDYLYASDFNNMVTCLNSIA